MVTTETTIHRHKPREHFIVKRTRTGLGLLNLRPIPSGKRIIEYTGIIITNEQVKKSRSKYLMELDEHHTIDGTPRANLARYINHSCRPNAEAYTSRKHVWIWSKRSIKAGEEITIDYGKEYFDDFIRAKGCGCEMCPDKRADD